MARTNDRRVTRTTKPDEVHNVSPCGAAQVFEAEVWTPEVEDAWLSLSTRDLKHLPRMWRPRPRNT